MIPPGGWAKRVQWLRTRIRISSRLYPRLPLRSLLGLAAARLGREKEIFYWAPGGGGRASRNEEVVELGVDDVIRFAEEEEGGIFPAARAKLYENVDKGARVFGVGQGGRTLHVSWLAPTNRESMPPFTPGSAKLWTISSCRTANAAAGRGLYTRAIRELVARAPAEDVVLIYTNDWNTASQRGIVKAGFVPFALRIRSGGASRFVPHGETP